MTKTDPLPLLVTPAVEITNVYFSSYLNPSTLNIEVKNPNDLDRDITVGIYIDNYATSSPDITINDTIPANTTKTITKNVSELNLSAGEHFVYCALQ